MRIISYNVLNGGEGRADPVAEVIEAQHADIVALIEADNTDVLERIAKRLNMDFIHAPGRKHAVALLSRWPIVDSINHAAVRPGPPCLLEVTVREPSGPNWIVGVTHLQPQATESDEAIRMTELGELMEIFAAHRDGRRPHILVGDFNANSPIQRIDVEKCKPRTREQWRSNGGYLPRAAVQHLLAAGYLDSLHAVNAELASKSGTFSTQFPEQRIDYIFTHGIEPTHLRKAWIEYDRLAKYASDHFPVGLEISPV